MAIPPGSTLTTCTPCGATSRRSESVIASSPNLEAAYGPKSGPATRPPIELMLITRPRARRIAGRRARVTATWPSRLTSSCRRHSSTGTVSTGPLTAIPALLTNAVSSPLTRSAALSMSDSDVTSSRSGSTPAKAGASDSRLTPASTV